MLAEKHIKDQCLRGLAPGFIEAVFFPFKMSFLLVTVSQIISGKHRLKELLFLLC